MKPIREQRGERSQVAMLARAWHRALRSGVRDALIRHKRLGTDIVDWRDGRLVRIPAAEIEIDEDHQLGPMTPDESISPGAQSSH